MTDTDSSNPGPGPAAAPAGGEPPVAPVKELSPEVQAMLAAAATELQHQKAQVQSLQDEKQTLRTQLDGLEAELVVQKREAAFATAELAQASAKTGAANQTVQEQGEALARLLAENKVLVTEREHLRTVLGQKDQMIAEVREAPQALMAELVQLRHQCEEATAHRRWMDAERDGAQLELARRALALGNAEEELRRLRHQNEQLERLTATKNEAGIELARVVQENSALAVELGQLRDKHTTFKQQLGACVKGVSLLVIELGVKIYALRAAVARAEGESPQSDSTRSIHAALDEMLTHLHDGNSHLQVLREIAAQTGPEPTVNCAQLPS